MNFVELDETKNLSATLENIVIDGVWSNFTGRPSQYANAGDKFIYVSLPSEVAQKMDEEGWNIRKLEIDGISTYHLKISAKKVFDSKTGNPLLDNFSDYADWQSIHDGSTIDIVGVYWNIPTRNRDGYKAYFVKTNR